jgi:hypothetical protein
MPLDDTATAGGNFFRTSRRLAGLKIAVVVMGIILVVGFVVLLACIIYLSAGRGEQASRVHGVEARLPVPPGAAVRTMSLFGNRLAVHYEHPSGGGIAVLDLATGTVISRVRLETDKPND